MISGPGDVVEQRHARVVSEGGYGRAVPLQDNPAVLCGLHGGSRELLETDQGQAHMVFIFVNDELRVNGRVGQYILGGEM